MYLPMSPYDWNRLIRWRRGWLPSKPVPCLNCHCQNTADRTHLTQCYDTVSRLDLPRLAPSVSPIDYLLNQLPYKAPTSEPRRTPIYFYWLKRWLTLLQFLKTSITNYMQTWLILWLSWPQTPINFWNCFIPTHWKQKNKYMPVCKKINKKETSSRKWITVTLDFFGFYLRNCKLPFFFTLAPILLPPILPVYFIFFFFS
jgi:hypothetical protein